MTSPRSGRHNPCPICGRTKDSDCEIQEDKIFCHTSSAWDALKPGDVVDVNGRPWFFAGVTDLGNAEFHPHKEGAPPGKPLQIAPSRPAPKPAPMPEAGVVFAWLEQPTEQPPEHLPDGEVLEYSASQWVTHKGKKYFPTHVNADGEIINKKGEEPWPMFNHDAAVTYGAGSWVLELEGEKCAMWAGAAGLLAVSQPGHDHVVDSIRQRYRSLKAAGVSGVVYIADNDDAGLEKANRCGMAAADEGLPFRWIGAADVWPGIPDKGSIDDAQGAPTERIASVLELANNLERLHIWQAPGASDEPEEMTAEQTVAAIEELALTVLDLPAAHRNNIFRDLVKDKLGKSLNARDAHQVINRVRSKKDGTIKERKGRRVMSKKPIPWVWEDMLIGESINILGAMPKVGKTSLILQAIAAWHYGAKTFLGKSFVGPCPPVVIIGSDQGELDWSNMLEAVHLPNESDPDGVRTPVREIWTMEDRMDMDEECLEIYKDVAADYPGALFLIDSVAATVSSMGIEEASPEMADPLRQFQAIVGKHGCTSLWVAHASKGRSGEDPVKALRGSTALPAVASQILGLAKMTESEHDERLILSTQGRGGRGQKLLLSRDDRGAFTCDGDATEVMLQQRLQDAEDQLTDEQATLLNIVRDRAARGMGTSLRDAVLSLSEDPESGAATDRARRRLQAIEKRGLLSSQKESNGIAQVLKWRPIGQKTGVASESTSKPSKPSELSVTKSSDGIEGSGIRSEAPLAEPAPEPDQTFEVVWGSPEILFSINLLRADQPNARPEDLVDVLTDPTSGFPKVCQNCELYHVEHHWDLKHKPGLN